MLYGLKGAILGIPDTQLSEKTKAQLKHYFANLCASSESS